MLLDGGSALPGEFCGFPHRIPAAEFLRRTGVTDLDLLVISHIHEDHVCGLEQVLEGVRVKEVRLPVRPDLLESCPTLQPAGEFPGSVHLFNAALSAAGRVLRRAREQGACIRTLSCGEVLQLPDGLELAVLGPAPEALADFQALLAEAAAAEDPTPALIRLDRTSNHVSLLLRLRGGGTDCLLPGDSCPGDWTRSAFSSLQNVTVLKLPHHGQKDSISQQFMEKMPLQTVVTTASSDRRYHSAAPEVYQALAALHPQAQFLFTDERMYPPYFSQPDGFQAIVLKIDSGRAMPEFIQLKNN